MSYHAGPWPSAMRLRCARDAECRDVVRVMFFGRFLSWSSVEECIRVEMLGGGLWGCSAELDPQHVLAMETR